jgi:hypothetical protein
MCGKLGLGHPAAAALGTEQAPAGQQQGSRFRAAPCLQHLLLHVRVQSSCCDVVLYHLVRCSAGRLGLHVNRLQEQS